MAVTRLMRIVVLAIALAAALGGIGGSGGPAEAATGYEQWVGPFNDGCYYHWDGYAYTMAGCPRADGGFDFYVGDGYGGWAHWFSTGYLADGTFWTYYGGQFYYGHGTSISSSDFGTTDIVIGGYGGGGLTTNVAANDILIATNDVVIGNILAPNCVEIVAGVCYTY
jgi:hypothetical protein